MKKNILVTLYSTALGGAEESTLTLVNGLSEKGLCISFLWVTSFKPESLTLKKGIKYYNIHLSPSRYKHAAPFIIAYLIVKDRISLVVHNFRFIKQESMITHFMQISNVAVVRSIFIDREDAEEFKYVDGIIGVANAVTDRLITLGYKGNTYTIYNGVEVEKLDQFTDIKKDPSALLSISRLVKWKRIDWSIQATHVLHQKGYPISLDIYGDGAEKESLLSLIEQLNAMDYIRYHGYTDKNNKELGKYGVFLIPSYAEPFGKTIVENILREKVIVGCNFGGIPELLPDKELLFERDSFDDYVIKIERALKNYAYFEKSIKRIKPSSLKKYSMKRVIDEYYAILAPLAILKG